MGEGNLVEYTRLEKLVDALVYTLSKSCPGIQTKVGYLNNEYSEWRAICIRSEMEWRMKGSFRVKRDESESESIV